MSMLTVNFLDCLGRYGGATMIKTPEGWMVYPPVKRTPPDDPKSNLWPFGRYNGIGSVAHSGPHR